MKPEEAADAVVRPIEQQLGERAQEVREAVRTVVAQAIEDEREECALQVEGGPVMYDSSSGEGPAVQTAREWFANAIRKRAESFARAERFLEKDPEGD